MFGRKFKQLDVQERYKDDPEFALHLRMIPALAFIPPQQVIAVFERLSDHIQQAYGEDALSLPWGNYPLEPDELPSTQY